MPNTYDVVIIGAGPAGMTAGIYAARSGLKILIIAKELGGTANSIVHLNNWPGFNGKGIELMKKFYEQLKEYPVEVVLEEVAGIEKKGKDFDIKTKEREVISKTIIIATGIRRRNLKIPGEDKFFGKGVSYCATCDGFFFKDKDVAFIAREDCKADEILELAKVANKVYILTDGKKLKCEKELKKITKIEIMKESIAREIKGAEKVEGLVVKTKKDEKELKIEGVFVDIGSVAITEFAKKVRLKLNNEENIVVDSDMNTSATGVFAAGDVTNSKVKQVLTASAQGAVAAKSAQEYLSRDVK